MNMARFHLHCLITQISCLLLLLLLLLLWLLLTSFTAGPPAQIGFPHFSSASPSKGKSLVQNLLAHPTAGWPSNRESGARSCFGPKQRVFLHKKRGLSEKNAKIDK